MKFNQYPYLNLTDLNLDYILNQMKTLIDEVTNFVTINAIKYANPIQWDIRKQYEKNTIVIDPLTGTAYISVAPVPAGVELTRTEFWTVVFDLSQFIVKASQNFSSHYEAQTTLTATFSTPAGGWLVWDETLFKALVNITAGDRYVIGSNIQHITVEDFYNEYVAAIAEIVEKIGSLNDLTTEDKSSIVAAINEVNSTGGGTKELIGDLADLDTTAKNNLVSAINEVLSTATDNYTSLNNLITALSGNVGNLSALTTDNKSSLVAAINEVNSRSTRDYNILFVGDSYGDNPNNTVHYPDIAASILGLDSNHYANLCASGAGFCTGTTYLQQISAWTGNRNAITHIIVLGGTNDHTLINDVQDAIDAFITYAKTNYPYAEVIVGCLTWQPIYPNDLNKLQDLNTAYQRAIDYGATIINNAWLAIHNYDLLFSDMVHPNDVGQNAIAESIVNFLKCGDFSNKFIKNYVAGTLSSSNGTWNNTTLRECQTGNSVIGAFNGNTITFTNAINIGTNLVSIGKISGGLIRGGYATPYAPVTAIINGSTSFIYVVISEGTVSVRKITVFSSVKSPSFTNTSSSTIGLYSFIT
jgi:lysophospholipase L1-like esterase